MSSATEDARQKRPSKQRRLLKKLLQDKAGQPHRVPASCSQRRLWFVNRLEDPNPSYNVPFYLTLDGPLDCELLEQSINKTIDRHASLRTSFVEVDGEPHQLIAAQAHIELPIIDLTDGPSTALNERVKAAIGREIVGLFELSQGPLLRAKLLKLGDRRHILVVVMHHIVSDGWSVGVFTRDLFKIYETLVGIGEELPRLSYQYPDYAKQQASWLDGEECQGQLDYWSRHLANLPLLDLPTDRPRPEVKGYRGKTHAFEIDAEVSRRLKRVAEEAGITLYMLLLAMFGILLQRHSGQTDIVLGTPIANRNEAEREDLVGFFVNMLVIRLDLSGDPDLRELLSRVSQIALAAYENQDLPFERLVEELRPERDTSRNPMFQVALAFQNEPMSGTMIDGLKVDPPVVPGYDVSNFDVDFTVTRFDIELHLWDGAASLRGMWVFDECLFDADTIARMSAHFAELLKGGAENPDQGISALKMLSPAERQQILRDWNETATDYPRHSSITDLFEAQVARTPDAPAVSYGEQSLSYSELNARANQLAAYLRRQGVGPNVLVAVCLERGLPMIIAILAIVKAGGAYVPLDHSYPKSRLACMLEDSESPVLLTETTLESRLPRTGCTVFCLDKDWSLVEAESSDNASTVVAPDNLAYINYTSGSTGQPKGVAIRHRAVLRLVCNSDYLQLRPDDRVLQASSVSFDAATFEIWGAFLNGGELVGIDRETSLDPINYARFLGAKGITVTFLTTALFNQVARDAPNAFRGMRAVLFGGEAVDVESVRRILDAPGRPQRLLHVYGPTESTTFASWHEVEDVAADATTVPIGQPVANTTLFVLDGAGAPVPVGVLGELYIGGDGLAEGYWRQPDLTAERFVTSPHIDEPEARLYRTGDIVRRRRDGAIEFVGRVDHQVKLRGLRIELGEIETKILAFGGIRQVVVVLRDDPQVGQSLVAYLSTEQGVELSVPELREFLQEDLPNYMLPSAIVELEALPLTVNGKIDRDALPEPETSRQVAAKLVVAEGGLQSAIANIWKDVLGLEEVGIDDNFFDLGGHSLLLAPLQAKVRTLVGRSIPMVDFFQYPTIRTFSEHLGQLAPALESEAITADIEAAEIYADEPIAVIGLAGRFPGAANVDEFWQNLVDGRETIHTFSDEELREAGIEDAVFQVPNYVAVKGYLADADKFDGDFFGYSPREAELMDPQQRIFLELAWSALESAGYDPARCNDSVGVYAGSSENSYWFSIMHNPEVQRMGAVQRSMAAGKDFLATRVAYKLNLHGPAVTVQTACSTSLTAVHEACKSLRRAECDIAMAGGVSVTMPLVGGYQFEEGSILSPDGHCRAFDAEACGTVAGNGAGIVVLKPLSRAKADGDTIYAVILGSAVNNDGSQKIGYTAPSVDGQADVIAKALSAAGVEPATIDYIETHGTGTNLGDPIEVAALKKAFQSVEGDNRIAIGALKSNIGHLDAAAGVSGLIKTVLALKNKKLPASLHFKEANPELHLAESPFYVNADLTEWAAKSTPRRAGVSSFGIGGTNVHMVLEEAPECGPAQSARNRQLIVLSARTAEALEATTDNLAHALAREDAPNLADVAYTLQVGRKRFAQCRVITCRDHAEAIDKLRRRETRNLPVSPAREPGDGNVAFMFSGQGSQHPNMTRDLYRSEALFKTLVDECSAKLEAELDVDLRELMFPSENGAEERVAKQLTNTKFAQPALFVIEYALAQLWTSWGVRPAAMIGHSIGEYAAACLAGVMSLDDALPLVAARGRLMASLPGGKMLAVPLSQDEVLPDLTESVSIATVNGPSMTVVSGPEPAILEVQKRLAAKGIDATLLHTSHAFHSPMMEPILAEFTEICRTVSLRPPQRPYISNVTGDWITAEQATDPAYYARHLRQAVLFAAGLERLFKHPNWSLLEVGPGNTLATLAARHPDKPDDQSVIASCRHVSQDVADDEVMLESLGQLWAAGVDPDWRAFHHPHRPQRVILPTYPFDRQRYWIEPDPAALGTADAAGKRTNLEDWFYVPSWKRTAIPTVNTAVLDATWLIFADDHGVGAQMADYLREKGATVVTVSADTHFDRRATDHYVIDPTAREDYIRLFEQFAGVGFTPRYIAHFWLTGPRGQPLSSELVATTQDQGFYSLLYLVSALASACGEDDVDLTVVSSHVHEVNGEETLSPERATLLGPIRAIAAEFTNLSARNIDISIKAQNGSAISPRVVEALVGEAGADARAAPVIAYRGPFRWVQDLAPTKLPKTDDLTTLRTGGTYLITGGFGGIGLALAHHLARSQHANLVLVGCTALPERREWPRYLAQAAEADPIAERIRKISSLEQEYGVEVARYQADVADRGRMTDVVDDALARFGAIHGVIHAAGVPGGGILVRQDREMVEQVFAPKIQGTLVLHELFQDRPLDFLMLCSSLMSCLSLPGRGEYIAANAFMDAFAQQASKENATPVIAVNWDAWVDVGMSLTDRDPKAPPLEAADGICNHEGVDAFERILGSGLPQVVVSVRKFSKQALESRFADLAAPGTDKTGPSPNKAEAHPRPALSSEYAEATNGTEQVLVRIWQDLLGIEPIGIDDNFYALGGDSVVSIQIVARSRQAGIELTLKQIFENQTIAELARVAEATSESAAVPNDQSIEFAPLTPIQHWFFEQHFPDQHHFNQATFLEMPERLAETALATAVRALMMHHDALRMRFVHQNGQLVQTADDRDTGDLPVRYFDLSDLDDAARRARIESLANELQRSLDIETGPIFRIAYFHLGSALTDRLLFIVHHLVVDAVAWRILLEDLQTACDQVSRGLGVELPAPTTSFRRWAAELNRHARSPEVEAELDFWLDLKTVNAAPLPQDSEAGENTMAVADTVTVEMDDESTRALLQDASNAYNTQINDLLLAALTVTLQEWTGSSQLLIDMEGHGRDIDINGVDISRTVGWFTTVYPIVLQGDDTGDLGSVIKATKERLRTIPNKGNNFGLLRYSINGNDRTAALATLPTPETVFLYLGRFDHGLTGDIGSSAGPESSGLERSERCPREHLLEITAMVAQDRFKIMWRYSTAKYRRETVERLAANYLKALHIIIEHCRSVQAPGYTPSDFPAARMSQASLDKLVKSLPKRADE